MREIERDYIGKETDEWRERLIALLGDAVWTVLNRSADCPVVEEESGQVDAQQVPVDTSGSGGLDRG